MTHKLVFKPNPCAVQLYWLCEALTGSLTFLMVIFGPWAFGTTEDWSMWTMNAGGLALGLLLAAKLIIRGVSLYSPARWNDDCSKGLDPASVPGWLSGSRLTNALVFLSFAIVGYCLVSALNARSTYRPTELSFVYHEYLPGLPHSLDSTSTWFAFWTCLGLVCSFWSVRDWLLGKSRIAARGAAGFGRGASARHPIPPEWTSGYKVRTVLSSRLRGLLWVLSINGGVLGLEAILQRFYGDGRLLFVLKPRFNPEAVTQFGPYAYRGNAAQYFNLLWPVCLGFWWTLQRSNGFQRGGVQHHLLLGFAAVMAACPMISSSRGGALVCLGLVLAAAMVVLVTDGFRLARIWDRLEGAGTGARCGAAGGLQVENLRCGRLESLRYLPRWWRARWPGRYWTVILVLGFAATALGLGFALGWKSLKPRLAQAEEDYVFRQQFYEQAKPMAADYPWFGTGPGTFESAFQCYRISSDSVWPAQLHNDWLETRITFGWIGSGLLGLALATLLLRYFAGGAIQGAERLALLIWLGLCGVLVHARFDFPFQVHSIVFLFVVLCAMVSVNRGAELRAIYDL